MSFVEFPREGLSTPSKAGSCRRSDGHGYRPARARPAAHALTTVTSHAISLAEMKGHPGANDSLLPAPRFDIDLYEIVGSQSWIIHPLSRRHN